MIHPKHYPLGRVADQTCLPMFSVSEKVIFFLSRTLTPVCDREANACEHSTPGLAVGKVLSSRFCEVLAA